MAASRIYGLRSAIPRCTRWTRGLPVLPQGRVAAWSSVTRATDTFVTTDWLADRLETVVPVDGSWHMPSSKRDAYKEYVKKRVKSARFFGIDEIKDKSSDLPHMLPTPETFAAAVGNLGISEMDHVVVYDSVGIFSAPRVYWTFKVFGHERVSILDGGLPKWVAEKRPTDNGQPSFKPRPYKAPSLNRALVRSYEDIVSNIENGPSAETYEQVIDARPEGRFNGTDPEPRPGLSSGHMPFATSMPFGAVVDQSTGTLLDEQALRELIEEKAIDLDKPIVLSCGSGVTATTLYAALKHVGAKRLAVYDGSWTEYASKETSKIVDKK